MLIANDTPFAAIGFGKLHRDGMEMAVLAARASYRLVSGPGLSNGAGLQLKSDQRIVLSDLFEGDPRTTPLVQVGDLIAYKPAADFTVLGTAHAPGGRPVARWDVAVAVGAHEARLQVHGPRRWEPAVRRFKPSWRLGPSEAAASVDLDYRLASGGRIAGDPDGGYDKRNPLGPGLLHADWSRIGVPLRAPQIDAFHAPVAEPFERPEPQGFGPVPPPWSWRARHLGTRDEVWRSERCPQAPADFSYSFHQTAPPSLIVPRLAGDEVVRLSGLLPGGEAIAFALPGVALVARHSWFDGRAVDAALTLDGVHVDLRGPEGSWSVDLTWRNWVARCPSYHGAVVALAQPGEASRMPSSGERGLRLMDDDS